MLKRCSFSTRAKAIVFDGKPLGWCSSVESQNQVLLLEDYSSKGSSVLEVQPEAKD